MPEFNERDFLEGLLLSFLHAQFTRWGTSDKLGGLLPELMPVAESVLVGATTTYLNKHIGAASAPAASAPETQTPQGTVITTSGESVAQQLAGEAS